MPRYKNSMRTICILKNGNLLFLPFFDPVTVQNTFIEFTMYILFFQLPLLVTNPRFMLAAAFDLGHAASRSSEYISLAFLCIFANVPSCLRETERIRYCFEHIGYSKGARPYSVCRVWLCVYAYTRASIHHYIVVWRKKKKREKAELLQMSCTSDWEHVKTCT